MPASTTVRKSARLPSRWIETAGFPRPGRYEIAVSPLSIPNVFREEVVMPGRFEGRKLIVVGGSSGMGKENAADVVTEGGSVVVVGRDKEQGRGDRG